MGHNREEREKRRLVVGKGDVDDDDDEQSERCVCACVCCRLGARFSRLSFSLTLVHASDCASSSSLSASLSLLSLSLRSLPACCHFARLAGSSALTASISDMPVYSEAEQGQTGERERTSTRGQDR